MHLGGSHRHGGWRSHMVGCTVPQSWPGAHLQLLNGADDSEGAAHGLGENSPLEHVIKLLGVAATRADRKRGNGGNRHVGMCTGTVCCVLRCHTHMFLVLVE